MKRESLVWKRFLEAVPSARRLAAVVVIPALFLSASAMAQGGAVRFHGKLVNTGCDVIQASTALHGNDVRYVEVSGITFQASAWRNACGGEAIPFTLQYKVMPATSMQATLQNQGQSQTGLLTLTYQ